MDILETLSKEFGIKLQNVKATVDLFDQGNTIPFVARYRKEVTGSLDDQILRELSERLNYLRNLEKRKEEVAAAIQEAEAWTAEIALSLSTAATLAEVEDIYRPFKKKKKTRASVAKEKGLEPLAQYVLLQAMNKNLMDYLEKAKEFIDADKGVESAEEALGGAKDIIAEQISDNPEIRKHLKNLLLQKGNIESKKSKHATDDSVYGMYFEFSEAVKKIAPHRVLALDRGEKEDMLKVSISVDSELACKIIKGQIFGAKRCENEVIDEVIRDSYDRLIFPSIEREIRSQLTGNAAEQAIKVFSLNLKNLLMQPPIKGFRVLGYDPGFRTGCKLAVVDETGKVLDTGVIYPTMPHNKIQESELIVCNLIKKHGIQAIAIGNGTASRESEAFIANLIKKFNFDEKVGYVVVSEAGASVYSASKLAAEEFPEYDVSLRSAVSIARRLQDPLAELVKIDPKAIGVGQYQHDMPQKRLGEALGGVVEDCVNAVGVDLNTASPSLLSHIAGINSTVAKNIVLLREQNGRFKTREQLLKVDKLGKKAYEQCAGFLRVSGGENMLDSTGVHPESYKATEALLEICDFDLAKGEFEGLDKKVQEIGVEQLSEKLGIGAPTINDIVKELIKPGRDPRDDLPKPILKMDVLDLDDLYEGLELTGTVRNVVDFGAFVDIGVHEDGLVHISQICDKFIKHPSEVLKVGDIVKVKVTSVDKVKKRIGLTMKDI